jgi:hypothetical protein
MADLSDAANWFETDASNNRPPPNGWPEGMLPSTVNDTARGDKGALKRFWDKVNPVQAITPASGVYTFTTSNIAYPAAYVEGEVYSFKPLAASIGGDSFQVNSLGGKPILKIVSGGTAPIAAQDIVALFAPRLIYNAALNAGAGAFVLLNPFVPVANNGAGGITLTGDVTAANLRATGNLYLGQNYVFYAGNTSGAIGPYAYADNTNFVTRLGSGNGGFYFENSAGTNVAQIDHNGSLIAQGNIALGGNSINFAGSGAGGPEVYGDATNMFMQLGPSNGTFYWYSHAGATLMTLAGGGGLTVNGTLVASGPSGIVQFVDRTGSPTWGWYATGNIARLWSSANGDRVTVDSGGNLTTVGNLIATGEVFAQAHASKAGFAGGFTGNSFNIEWRPPSAHLWIDTSDLGAIVLADGGGNVTVAGTLTVNGGGYAISAPAGDIRAGGSVFIGGTQLYNNGGLVYSPNGLRAAQMLSDGALTVSGTSTLGYLTAGTAYFGGDVTIHGGGYGLTVDNGGITAAGVSSFPNITLSAVGVTTALDATYAAGSAVVYARNGGMSAAAFNVVSDARLKAEIANSAIGLDAILGLAPRTFRRIATPEREELGLVAQEVAAVLPHAVATIEHEDDDHRLAIDYAPITAALINAVKELTGRIVTLEAK